MHDAAERGDRRPASVAALRDVLALMKRRGLPGVSLRSWSPMRVAEVDARDVSGGAVAASRFEGEAYAEKV